MLLWNEVIIIKATAYISRGFTKTYKRMRKDSKQTVITIMRLMLTALLPILMLAACNDSYPTIISNDGSYIGNGETYSRTPIMLFVNEQNYFSITATRGTGVFAEDKVGKYENSVFYVFAFRDGGDLQGALSYETDLRRTVFSGRQGFYDVYRSDCLLDGPGYLLGMPTLLGKAHNGTLEMQTDSNFYYSARYQDVGYNFFVYHLDSCEVVESNVHRQEDRIYYDITIDGSQDIMAGFAPKLTREVLEDKMSDGHLAISSVDQEKILNIGNYSTFAAHRGVNPVVQMNHLLTQMQFFAYPGDESADSIRIKGIKVESKYKGAMTVASRNTDDIGLSFYDDRKFIELRDSSDGKHQCPPLKEDGYVVHWNKENGDEQWQQRDSLRIGGCLMLAPDSLYTLVLTYEQTIDKGSGGMEVKTLESHYRLHADKTSFYYDQATGKYIFKPGYVYTIKIVVYGLQDIEVSVGFTPWQNGGDVNLDPDDDTGGGEHIGDVVVD